MYSEYEMNEEKSINGENPDNDKPVSDSGIDSGIGGSPTDTLRTDEASGADMAKPVQTREQNAAFARRRREEKYRSDIAAARSEGIISALGGRNPYTGKEMKNEADSDEYMLMRHLKNEGFADIESFIERKKLDAEKEAQEAKKREFYRSDGESFARDYPDTKITDLINDAAFCRFAKGRVGITPLSELYSDYLELKSALNESAASMAAQALANSISSPGALSVSGSVNDYFTPEQVDSMSQNEILENYDRIRESMKYWK